MATRFSRGSPLWRPLHVHSLLGRRFTPATAQGADHERETDPAEPYERDPEEDERQPNKGRVVALGQGTLG